VTSIAKTNYPVNSSNRLCTATNIYQTIANLITMNNRFNNTLLIKIYTKTESENQKIKNDYNMKNIFQQRLKRDYQIQPFSYS